MPFAFFSVINQPTLHQYFHVQLYKLFREQSASGQRKKQITLFMYLPIPLDCTPIFTN